MAEPPLEHECCAKAWKLACDVSMRQWTMETGTTGVQAPPHLASDMQVKLLTPDQGELE